MTPAELLQLLARPESEGVECKPALLSRREAAEYAVGIGNSGGGWLLMGVSDRIPRSVLPFDVPPDAELAKLRESVADSAGIHVAIERVETTDGPVLAMQIPPRPRGTLFHTRDGKYMIRLGEGLRGMTLAEIDAIRREAGTELTAGPVPGALPDLISPAAMEELRRLMQEAGAPADLLGQGDADLLRSLGVVTGEGTLLMAGLLLAGKAEVIRTHLPHAQWQFRRMLSDTQYDQAEDGYDCLPLALKRLRELVAANNPVVTIPVGLVHPEFPRYPTLALREIIVNALAHRDYTVPGAVTLKLYPDRLELSNPGGFVGGVTPQNILHHPSAPRYPAVFNALARMRLANAANLGVPRVFRDLLSEGKEPPTYWCSQHAVGVVLAGGQTRRAFLELVQHHLDLDVDHLLVLHYLTRHRELTARRAAELCQRPPAVASEILSRLAAHWRLLETGGSGRGRYYRLARSTYESLIGAMDYHVDRRLALENAKARVLAVLAERDLTNSQIREITQMGRSQALWLMKTLEKQGVVSLEGKGRASRWRSAAATAGNAGSAKEC
jgi:ATP-dependent DNA helicase RecG